MELDCVSFVSHVTKPFLQQQTEKQKKNWNEQRQHKKYRNTRFNWLFELLSIVSGEEGDDENRFKNSYREANDNKTGNLSRRMCQVKEFYFLLWLLSRPEKPQPRDKRSEEKAIFINVISLLPSSVILTFPSKVTHFNFYPSAFPKKKYEKENQT